MLQRLSHPAQHASTNRVGAAAKPSASAKPALHTQGYAQIRKRRCNRVQQLRAVPDTERDLEAEVEEFMRRQAESESGFAPRQVDPEKVFGADEVSEDDAKRMCREVVKVLRTLQETRDMTVNEVKLTVQIEDPRAREQRAMDMEASLVARDELAAALGEIAEGRVPKDRIALRELYKEMSGWPFLEGMAAKGPSIADLDPSLPPVANNSNSQQRDGRIRPPMGRDPNDKPQGLADMLPDWMGYGALYLVSIIPVLITVTVVAVLFFNSLR